MTFWVAILILPFKYISIVFESDSRHVRFFTTFCSCFLDPEVFISFRKQNSIKNADTHLFQREVLNLVSDIRFIGETHLIYFANNLVKATFNKIRMST